MSCGTLSITSCHGMSIENANIRIGLRTAVFMPVDGFV
jgi:hypothetical protein